MEHQPPHGPLGGEAEASRLDQLARDPQLQGRVPRARRGTQLRDVEIRNPEQRIRQRVQARSMRRVRQVEVPARGIHQPGRDAHEPKLAQSFGPRQRHDRA